MNSNLFSILKIVLHQAVRFKFLVTVAFAVISLTCLYAGITWPKTYSSSTSILVDQKDAFVQAMGKQIKTDLDYAKLATEILYGRKLLNKAIVLGKWVEKKTPDAMKEKFINKVRNGINITNERNLIRIKFTEKDPDLVFVTTQLLADLFIGEIMSSKTAESKDAYDFVKSKTEEYKLKVDESRKKLQAFLDKNKDASPQTKQEIQTLIHNFTQEIASLTQKLREEKIRLATLREDINKESATLTSRSRVETYENMRREMQQQLDTMRLRFHDSYPDIVKLKHQIADLNESIRKERQKSNTPGGGTYNSGGNTVANPFYEELRRQMQEARTNIRTYDSRLRETKRQLALERERLNKVQKVENAMLSLKQDHDVNMAVYQKFLGKREDASINFSLNRDQKGLSVRVYEKAYFPYSPNQLSLKMFAMGGIGFGLMMPIGLIYLLLLMKQQVRANTIITEKLKIPMLGVVPHMSTASERRSDKIGVAVCLVAITIVIISIILIYIQSQSS